MSTSTGRIYKRALVIGGTSGVGEGVARALAKTGQFHVTVCGRSVERGAEVVSALKQAANNKPDLKFNFLQCNCFQINNIKVAADTYVKENGALDVLVLSQGMATIQGFTPTLEGLDQKLALHYFGRFAFIDFLLPALRKGSSPKVMSVLSAGIHSPYSEFKADFELKSNYSIKNAADSAGFYNDLALDVFSEDVENKSVQFIHVAPGFVRSNWGTEMPFYIRWPLRVFQLLGRSIADTGDLLAAPLLNEASGGGLLLQNYTSGRCSNAEKTSLHSADAKEFVFRQTKDLLGRILGSGKL